MACVTILLLASFCGIVGQLLVWPGLAVLAGLLIGMYRRPSRGVRFSPKLALVRGKDRVTKNTLWLSLAITTGGLFGLADVASANSPDPIQVNRTTDNTAVQVYLRPYLGWGWKVVTAPQQELSWYKFGWGVSSGVAISRLAAGVDFNYFNGTHILGQLNSNPAVSGEGRMNAFRLAADVGYDVARLRWFTLRPHVIGGIEWRRLTIGEDYTGVRRSAFWGPGIVGLVPVRVDGRFALGVDARWNMILIDGTIYNHMSGFLAAESRF